jgi:hypothetical protein
MIIFKSLFNGVTFLRQPGHGQKLALAEFNLVKIAQIHQTSFIRKKPYKVKALKT